MDGEDYVDTSDPEERAELFEFFPNRITTSSPRLRIETPRKRRKVDHHGGLDSPYTPSRINTGATVTDSPPGDLYRRGMVEISSTPQLVSFATSPTAATAELPSPFTRKTVGFNANNDHEATSQDNRQIEVNENSTVDVSLSDMEMSDDELDVMSQGTRGSVRSQRSKSIITSTISTAASPFPHTSLPKMRIPLRTPNRDAARTEGNDGIAETIPTGLSLLIQQNALSPAAGRNDKRAISPLSPLSSADGDRAQQQLPRFSSLPPSSPIRASTLANTPQRARTHSPANSQAQSRVGEGREDIPQHLLEEENAPRRYSMRNRQPKQLNPYEYDKRMYKMQLRRIPDAIVKVVSPPKNAGEHGHRHKSREAEYDEFIAPEETEESQEQRQAKKHHRKHTDGAEEFETAKSDWMKEFDLSDDELPPLPSPRKPAVLDDHDEAVRRRRRKKPFPLEVELRRIRPAFEEERPFKEPHIAIAYGRRQKRRPEHSPRADKYLNAGPSHQPSVSEDIESHNEVVSFEVNNSGFTQHDDQFDLGPWDNTPGVPFNQRSPSIVDISKSDAAQAGTRYRFETPDYEQQNDNEDKKENSRDGAEGNEGSDEEEETQEEVDRKQYKALRRMLPAFMVNKMLDTQAQPQSKPNAQRRSLSMISPVQSSEDEGPLVPGKSMIRRRPGVGQAPLQIKGDSESSEEEPIGVTKDRTTISIVSSDSEAFGVESEQSDEDQGDVTEGDNRLDDLDDDISKHYQSSRGREDLIDRMLSRTRTDGIRKTARRKRQRHGHKRAASGHTAKLRKTGLDVTIPVSRSRTDGHQTRLPFAPVTVDHSSDTSEKYVDLNGAPDEVQLDEIGLEHPKKLTKKQRQEAVLQKQLFTVNNGHKLVGNGRKKGFIQIDIEDEAFHAALAPVRSDKSEKPRRIFKKTVSEVRAIAMPKKQGFLKQSSLHDFPHHDDGVLVDIGRLAYQDNHGDNTDDTAWREDTDAQSMTKLTVDFEICPVLSGVRFGASTCLGKHMLHDLIAYVQGGSESRIPLLYSDFEGINLSQDMTPSQFAETLEISNNVLCDWMSYAISNDDIEEMHADDLSRHEALMSSLIQTCIWLFTHRNETDRKQLLVVVADFLRRLKETIRDRLDKCEGRSLRSNIKILSVLWFNVNLSSRWSVLCKRSQADVVEEWPDAVTLLMEHLLSYNLQKALNTIHLAGNTIDEETELVRVAELWICLIYLLPSISSLSGDSPSSDQQFWSYVQRALKVYDVNGKPDLENSEYHWRLLFGLSALGQFTIHGVATSSNSLPTSWEIVATSLDSIKLVHSPSDDKLPFAALRKRDYYVRMVVARCYLLGTRWHWPMSDAYVMFNKLVEIFKSRKFGNLLGEESDFPAFLRYSNLHMLTELRKSDSAFGLFLKLVVLAGKSKDNSEPVQRVNARLRKLLSLTVPLSGVPFTKANPPLGQELSMLYNRFSSIIVAIYLEPTAVNLRIRLAQARRYVTFSQADWKSRQACVRALMYISILVRHLKLPLDEPSLWLEEMVESLLHDYDDAESALKAPGLKQVTNSAFESKSKVVLTIQLLLGCVRKILETQTMEPGGAVDICYPPLILIDAPWIKKIFAKKDLTATFTTRMEILKLLLSFLDARNKIVPPPRRPALVPLVEAETQESQDEYGPFDIDINDPDLIAALDNGGESSVVDENKAKDVKVAEIMDSCILPLVLRLMMQQVHDSTTSAEARLEEYWLDIDKWVDCWVRCASIVVANEKRNWSHYLNLGSQSWKIISDSSLRRRVGLRFMWGLLVCDPTSYKDQQESYHEVLLESMVANRVTVEHEYVSLLFSIDGLRHCMLRGIAIHREDEEADFKLTKSQFMDQRLGIINSILQNLDTSLTKCARGEFHLQYLCNRWVDFTLTMLSTVKDILENIQSEMDKAMYQNFSSKLFNVIKDHQQLQCHPRLSPLVVWGATLGASA